jgi:hypothetical protein
MKTMVVDLLNTARIGSLPLQAVMWLRQHPDPIQVVYFTFAALPNHQNPQKQVSVITADQMGGEKEPLQARSSAKRSCSEGS